MRVKCKYVHLCGYRNRTILIIHDLATPYRDIPESETVESAGLISDIDPRDFAIWDRCMVMIMTAPFYNLGPCGQLRTISYQRFS